MFIFYLHLHLLRISVNKVRLSLEVKKKTHLLNTNKNLKKGKNMPVNKCVCILHDCSN